MRAKQKSKLRKSTKYAYLIISIALFMFSFINLLQNFSKENMKTRTKEIYKYTNKFKYDYNINLKDNKYIDKDAKTDKNLVYVTDLIDTTDFDYKYTYLADKKSDLTYSYSIVGKTQAVYSKDGDTQKIMNEEESLFEKKDIHIQSDKIDINEKLNLDLKNKNKLLNEFKQEMGMTITADYTLIFKINVSTEIEGEKVTNNYMSSIKIDLASKTSKISGENNKEESKYISKEYKVNSATNVLVIIVDIVGLVIAFAMFKYAMKAKVANTIKNEYKHELNRILKLCQDKIVYISEKPVDKTAEIVAVKNFGEIVKVSEELFKPILYYFDSENDEAWFSVMSNNVIYRYILKK